MQLGEANRAANLDLVGKLTSTRSPKTPKKASKGLVLKPNMLVEVEFMVQLYPT